MKVEVVYASMSGSTRRLAQGIYDALEGCDKRIVDLAHEQPDADADVLLMGYWVDKGAPCERMKQYMATVSGKYVGVFCTLGYYSDTAHARAALDAGIDAVKANNVLLGSYVCNGAMNPALIENFRARGAATPQNELRWQLFADHPTPAEIALAGERFNERIELLRGFQAKGLEFASIV